MIVARQAGRMESFARYLRRNGIFSGINPHQNCISNFLSWLSFYEMINKAFLPCELLAPYVRMMTIEESASGGLYKVLPDTNLVMGFQYKGAVFSVEDEKPDQLSSSGITGFPSRFRLFRAAPATGTVLVFFRETGAAMFFKEPLHEFSGQSISLDNFSLSSQLSLFQEKLQEATTDIRRVRVVEEFLISRLQPRQKDLLVEQAIGHIHGSKGTIPIKELSKKLNTSKSPLEKRFRKTVGASPKKFASLVQLKNALSLYQPKKPLTKIAYDAGFYDQAHFIKQFKILTGETPEKFFSTNHK